MNSDGTISNTHLNNVMTLAGVSPNVSGLLSWVAGVGQWGRWWTDGGTPYQIPIRHHVFDPLVAGHSNLPHIRGKRPDLESSWWVLRVGTFDRSPTTHFDRRHDMSSDGADLFRDARGRDLGVLRWVHGEDRECADNNYSPRQAEVWSPDGLE